MQTHQSGYKRWTWIIAIILVLILLWMLFAGHGPSASCCAGNAELSSQLPATAPATTAAPPIADPFSFQASASAFSSKGDTSGVAWLANSAALQQWLANGSDWSANGDANKITLTGTVASETLKEEKGAELQALLGSQVMIDNQMTVQAPAPEVAPNPPDTAKLYFGTGKMALPDDSALTLEPIVIWLNANPQAKAVISGFHDATGKPQRNAKLAKARAQSTYDALVAAGIDATRIEMRKPIETDGDGSLEEARRVEVTVE